MAADENLPEHSLQSTFLIQVRESGMIVRFPSSSFSHGNAHKVRLFLFSSLQDVLHYDLSKSVPHPIHYNENVSAGKKQELRPFAH